MFETLLAWLNQPFSSDMPASRWFLFIGLLLAMLWGWHQIFRELAVVEGNVT